MFHGVHVNSAIVIEGASIKSSPLSVEGLLFVMDPFILFKISHAIS